MGNLLRDDERAAERLEESHRQAAAATAQVLGSLKGGAMKLGQLASFVELEFIPEEFRELYQSELACLRDAAPPVDWPTVRSVLEEEWGAPPESVLAHLEHEPAAAASIGQVHRGLLRDGRRVAVKVQYPEVARAVEADVFSAMLLLRGARGLARGVDPRALAHELRDRVLEELDYELEAQHQRAFARAYRGHPFIVVPDVVTGLCGRRVLVSEWMDGAPWAEIRELPQAERDRFAEILLRFYFGALDLLGRFNADPHPGNYMLRPDGSVAFLDFGAVKVITHEFRRRQNELAAAYIAGDAVGVRRVMAALGFFSDPERFDAQAVMESVRAGSGWILDPGETELGPSHVRANIQRLFDPRNEVTRALREASFPPDQMWFVRLELGMVAVLAQLRARGDWHRIAREAWFGDSPATELGRLSWEFLADRPLWRDPRADAPKRAATP